MRATMVGPSASTICETKFVAMGASFVDRYSPHTTTRTEAPDRLYRKAVNHKSRSGSSVPDLLMLESCWWEVGDRQGV